MSTMVDIARSVRWYVHSVMGDNAYEKYVRHQCQHHPEASIPSEREFWRQKHEDAERNPKTRCC